MTAFLQDHLTAIQQIKPTELSMDARLSLEQQFRLQEPEDKPGTFRATLHILEQLTTNDGLSPETRLHQLTQLVPQLLAFQRQYALADENNKTKYKKLHDRSILVFNQLLEQFEKATSIDFNEQATVLTEKIATWQQQILHVDGTASQPDFSTGNYRDIIFTQAEQAKQRLFQARAQVKSFRLIADIDNLHKILLEYQALSQTEAAKQRGNELAGQIQQVQQSLPSIATLKREVQGFFDKTQIEAPDNTPSLTRQYYQQGYTHVKSLQYILQALQLELKDLKWESIKDDANYYQRLVTYRQYLKDLDLLTKDNQVHTAMLGYEQLLQAPGLNKSPQNPQELQVINQLNQIIVQLERAHRLSAADKASETSGLQTRRPRSTSAPTPGSSSPAPDALHRQRSMSDPTPMLSRQVSAFLEDNVPARARPFFSRLAEGLSRALGRFAVAIGLAEAPTPVRPTEVLPPLRVPSPTTATIAAQDDHTHSLVNEDAFKAQAHTILDRHAACEADDKEEQAAIEALIDQFEQDFPAHKTYEHLSQESLELADKVNDIGLTYVKGISLKH